MPCKKVKECPLAVLFEKEDKALQGQGIVLPNATGLSVDESVDRELLFYKEWSSIPTYEDPAVWWWEKREALPILFHLSESYMSVQASSTPSERVFSTARNTISQERSHVDFPSEKLIFFVAKMSKYFNIC